VQHSISWSPSYHNLPHRLQLSSQYVTLQTPLTSQSSTHVLPILIRCQMCCDHVHSPQLAQGHRLPLLLPDPSLLVPVRQQQQQQQQVEEEQQPVADISPPSSSSIARAEISAWAAVGSCSTGHVTSFVPFIYSGFRALNNVVLQAKPLPWRLFRRCSLAKTLHRRQRRRHAWAIQCLWVFAAFSQALSALEMSCTLPLMLSRLFCLNAATDMSLLPVTTQCLQILRITGFCF
jgi:hypothetical protein